MKKFSESLQKKVETCLSYRRPTQIGRLNLSSKLILAPMAGITDIPFRLFMQDLGAGCTVSELIAATGLHYQNDRTHKMFQVAPKEKCVGLQLFGDNPEHMASAAQVAEERGAHFVDINMGCPVRKVVKKGAGSALLINPNDLYDYLNPIKKAIKIPLTIKIRTGWDKDSLNADEVIKIAKDLEIEWVAIHGRTREQQYTGAANWEYLENLGEKFEGEMPLIGNGDLNGATLVHEKLHQSNMKGLMLGRGPLRNPFLFLESLIPPHKREELRVSYFSAKDYLEIIERLYDYQSHYYDNEKIFRVSFNKLVVWMAAGYPNAAHFRGKIFSLTTPDESYQFALEFFSKLEAKGLKKQINFDAPFMNGGHG